MTARDDELMRTLSGADPVGSDPPPVEGSTRYHSILEGAMRPDAIRDHASTTTRDRTRLRRWAGRRLALTAAAAVVIAAVVTVGVLQPGHEPSAVAAVRTAAINTGDTESLRATVKVQYADGSSSSTLGEMNGLDVRLETEQVEADGTISSSTLTVVGDTGWETSDGSTAAQPVGEDRLVPFADASEAVLKAALKAAGVTDLGSENIDGVDATHYQIELDDAARTALAALTPGELAWFELEYPDSVTLIDVWVADNLVHRIQVRSEDSTSTTDFFDFGAAITIVPPAES
jgi:hypothetical protein